MSLINEMLKNLERRHPEKRSVDQMLDGVHLFSTQPMSQKRIYLIAVGVVIVVLGAARLIYILHSHHQSAVSSTIPLVSATPHVLTPNMMPAETIQPHSSTALLTGVALQVKADTSSLRFWLSQGALYQLNYDFSKNTLNIILEHTSLLAVLPKLDYNASAVKNIQTLSDENGNLKIAVTLMPGAEIKSLNLDDQGKSPELQLDLAYQPTSIATATTTAEVVPVSPPQNVHPIVESTAQREYARALNLSAEGHHAEAIALLSALLDRFPDYQEGRLMLVRLLLHQGDQQEARREIDIGLEIQPNSVLYTELKARILVDEGQVPAALKLLEKNEPDLASNPEYHAFIAGLYQQLGKPALALSLYKQLLNLDSHQAKWWVGLGVALNALGQHTQAVEAFSNADALSGLSPELKAYVQTQINN